MRVEVVRSARRRKTVELKPIADGVRISIPANATKAEEERYVSTLLRRYERRKQTTELDLAGRARKLARELSLETPRTIRWSENQSTRWGSCTPSTRTIRISSAVARFPTWVIDYVIVHELAHLTVHGHGPDFWHLVGRYELAERARGFLIAKGMDGEADQQDDRDVEEEEDQGDGDQRAETSPPAALPTSSPYAADPYDAEPFGEW